MIGTKRKPVKDKTRCDGCRRTVAAVHEYEFRVSGRVTHWIDLCDLCGLMNREVREGYVQGIHFPLNAPAKAAKSAPQRTQAAGSVFGRPAAKQSA